RSRSLCEFIRGVVRVGSRSVAPRLAQPVPNAVVCVFDEASRLTTRGCVAHLHQAVARIIRVCFGPGASRHRQWIPDRIVDVVEPREHGHRVLRDLLDPCYPSRCIVVPALNYAVTQALSDYVASAVVRDVLKRRTIHRETRKATVLIVDKTFR